MKTLLLFVLIFTVGIGLLIFSGALAGPTIDTAALQGTAITVYKSPTCGCCELYVTYLEQNGLAVEVVEQTDLKSIEEQYGVPSELTSCHTSIIGDYVVEGHVPLEAIVKLVTEKPDIKGIALPGMPSGSPGMPGVKEPFKIQQIENSGEYSPYLTL